ncbi:MAG: hypothetical protein E4G71_00120 [Candidatus Atribacteria bacterium]|nr:MAG: hypothetical protein E4G71_00120 [Candidatus Atribacteria bacterium]
MDTKLTLNVDSELVQKAKLYAKDKGRSLSDLVEMYFKALTHRKAISDKELTPKVKSLLGSFKVPPEFNYKKELSDQLTNKYL